MANEVVLRDLPAVVLEPGVPLDRALKELKRRLELAGVSGELKRRESARSLGERRREKAGRARARERKRARNLAVAEGSRG